MVYFTYVDKDSLTILCIIPEIKLFSTTFLSGGALISMPGLMLLMSVMSILSSTCCCLRARRVKYRRATSNRFTTRIRNCHIRFVKNVGNRSSALELFVSSFTEHNPPSSPSVVLRKSKIREVRSIMSAISTNSYSTILNHCNPK